MATVKRTKQDLERCKSRLLELMINHVGAGRMIGMGELYEQVFAEPYGHRINDTRPLRKLIDELQKTGLHICSRNHIDGYGYFVASTDSELREYCAGLRRAALKKLKKEATLRKIAMPELLGQIRMEFEIGDG